MRHPALPVRFFHEAIRCLVRGCVGTAANSSFGFKGAAWLHDQVGPAYDALKADPSRGITPEGVRAYLAAEHAKVT